jgi:hypothetical protein
MKHYKTALEKLLSNLEIDDQTVIYIKYKGTELKEERNITEALLEKRGFLLQYLQEDEILELFFLKYQNLTVLGNGSSLLIYAKLAGHKVGSLFYYLPNIYDIPLATSYPNLKGLIATL